MIGVDSLAVTPARLGSGLSVAIFTAIALGVLVASLVVLYRGFKRFTPETRAWMAGFFEQNTSQSSTRLVGILSFAVATILCAFIVVTVVVGSWLGVPSLSSPAGTLTGLLIAVLTLLFANACVALGLRKAGENGEAAPASTGHEPPAA